MTERLPVNEWPVNRAARKWLLKVPDGPLSPDKPYLFQLLWVGFDRDLPAPGVPDSLYWRLSQAAGRMLAQSQRDPVALMRWAQESPDGPSEPEQAQDLLAQLREAKDWQEACQNLMEVFYHLSPVRHLAQG